MRAETLSTCTSEYLVKDVCSEEPWKIDYLPLEQRVSLFTICKMKMIPLSGAKVRQAYCPLSKISVPFSSVTHPVYICQCQFTLWELGFGESEKNAIFQLLLLM